MSAFPGAQRVSREVSAEFMEMLRKEQPAVEAGTGWAEVSARLEADPRLQVRRELGSDGQAYSGLRGSGGERGMGAFFARLQSAQRLRWGEMESVGWEVQGILFRISSR